MAIATLFLTSSADEPSAAVIKTWHTIPSSRMAIHAIICGMGAISASQCLTAEQSRNREVLAHREKALHPINNESSNLSYVNKSSEVLIFSILAMTTEPPDASPQAMDMDRRTLSHIQEGQE